jgi:hypothetical protein
MNAVEFTLEQSQGFTLGWDILCAAVLDDSRTKHGKLGALQM